MLTTYSLEEIPSFSAPVVLTIGNFDGLHAGHQAVIHHLLKTAKEQQAKCAVITFSNHPSTILRPSDPTPLLCSTEHKLLLLEKTSVDLAVVLPFTQKFSEQSADEFLQRVKQFLPFHTLILGSDAHIGKNREGDRTTVTALAKTLGFTVEYFSDIHKHGKRVSSSLIREYIQQGQLMAAAELLGRPFSICGKVLKGSGKGETLGFPTANIDVAGLCLPPLGVYAVSLFDREKELQGIANLGFAPTVHHERNPILEVHVFDHKGSLYEKIVDVHFHEFIRAEKRFASIEELRSQIAQDVIQAKKTHRIP